MALVTSCGFPGPLISYHREIDETRLDSISERTVSKDYFCLDYDKNFECQKIKTVVTDNETGQVVRILVSKGTQMTMRGGRQKTKGRIVEFDEHGKVCYRSRTIWQQYGRVGRRTLVREVTHLENGQKEIIVARSTLRNPHKLEKTRLRGRKYK